MTACGETLARRLHQGARGAAVEVRTDDERREVGVAVEEVDAQVPDGRIAATITKPGVPGRSSRSSCARSRCRAGRTAWSVTGSL